MFVAKDPHPPLTLPLLAVGSPAQRSKHAATRGLEKSRKVRVEMYSVEPDFPRLICGLEKTRMGDGDSGSDCIIRSMVQPLNAVFLTFIQARVNVSGRCLGPQLPYLGCLVLECWNVWGTCQRDRALTNL